ncbi:MAG: hypothetical protein ACYC7E_21115 [Armatimonadota bacterium]
MNVYFSRILCAFAAMLALGSLAWGVVVEQPAAAKNLCQNGDFETGITGWVGQVRDNAAKKTEQHPEFLSWEQTDTCAKLPAGAKPEKSAGALKVIMKDIPAGSMTHQTGIVCKFNDRIAPEANDLVVTFSARLLEPAEANLHIQRTWGGGGGNPVNLTREWKQYWVYVPIGFETPELIFSLVAPNTEGITPLKVINGSFLLDNVVVQTAPKPVEQAGNLIKNGDFECDTFGWFLRVYVDNRKTLTLPGEYLSWERADLPKTGAKTTGAMKVTLKNLPVDTHSHMTGAVINFNKSVKVDEGNLKITFQAKLLSPEKANLQVSRLYGGGNCVPVEVKHEWGHFEVTMPVKYDVGSIVFNLVPPDAAKAQIYPVIDGVFLLDNVVVTTFK